MSRLRWIPSASLPDDLRAELTTDPTIAVRVHRDSRSDRWLQLLLIPGLAGVIAGVLGHLVAPSGPWPSPVRAALLIGGGVALGLWLAWYRTRSLRPLAGQAVLVTPSTVVIADTTSVAILPAEALTFDGSEARAGQTLIHRGDEHFVNAVARAARADAETRRTDPWRWVADREQDPAPAPLSRRPRLVRGALVGLGAALVLELVGSATLGRAATNGRRRAWADVRERLVAHLDRIDHLEDVALNDQLASDDNIVAMADLAAQATALGDDVPRAHRVLQAYRELLADQLAQASSASDVLVLLLATSQVGLPERDLLPLRDRYGALTLGEDQLASPTAIADDLARFDRWKVPRRHRDALLQRLALQAAPIVEGEDLGAMYKLYEGSLEVVPEEHSLMAALRTRMAERLRALLPAVKSTNELFDRYWQLRQDKISDEINQLLDARFVALVQKQAATIDDSDQLLDYLQLGLEGEAGDFLRSRFEEVSLVEIRRAKTTDEIEHFVKEAEDLHLSDQFVKALDARLAELPPAPAP